MKFIWIFYIFLINKVLLQSNEELGKYGKITTDSATVFFDSTDFAINKEIYLIITGEFYSNSTYIDYAFTDNYLTYEENLLKREYFNKNKQKDNKREERYFTIEKTQDKIKNGETGKYLIIYTFMKGSYIIENTDTNKGNSKAIFNKYDKHNIDNPIIFFNISDFKVGDEIYFKISGKFTSFEDEDNYYIIIEYINGPNLSVFYNTFNIMYNLAV